jgi:hypothetical protein
LRACAQRLSEFHEQRRFASSETNGRHRVGLAGTTMSSKHSDSFREHGSENQPAMSSSQQAFSSESLANLVASDSQARGPRNTAQTAPQTVSLEVPAMSPDDSARWDPNKLLGFEDPSLWFEGITGEETQSHYLPYLSELESTLFQ